MYEVREVPGKGLGLIATRPIAKGTCIFSETPILKVPLSMSSKGLHTKVLKLSDEHMQSFISLSNIHPHDTLAEQYDGIVRTNSFEMGDGLAAVAIEASRINHACDNNSMHCWNENLGQVTVYAIRDIETEEEITTNYVGRGLTRQERQTELQDTYQISCVCGICSLPAELSAAVDRKIERYWAVWTQLKRSHDISRHVRNPLQRFRDLEEVVHHAEELGSYTQLYEAYAEVTALCIAHSDVARAKILFERAYNSYITEHGTEDSTAKECADIREDVTTSDCFGFSTRWKTTEGDIPLAEVQFTFEDWLWKKDDNVIRPSPLADLHDYHTFLGIGGLPTEGLHDIEYHEEVPSNRGKPRRHWCFVGQIMENAVPEDYFELRIKDVDEHMTFAVFHEGRTHAAKRYKTKKNKRKCTETDSVNSAPGGETPRLETGKDRIVKKKEEEGSTLADAKSAQPFSKNDTILILYAERENISETTGEAIVNVTDDSMVKVKANLLNPSRSDTHENQVLPFPLKKLLAASTRVQEYIAICKKGQHTCHGCEKRGSEFDLCGRCKIFRYCSKVGSLNAN